MVAAGAGHFERMPFGHSPRWRVQHAECAIKHRGEADAITQLRNEQQRALNERRRQAVASGTGKAAQKARNRIRKAGGEDDRG